MNNNPLWRACFVVLIGVGLAACGNNKSAGLDENGGATASQDSGTRSDNPFAFLWPGNWGEGGSGDPQEADQEQEPQAVSTSAELAYDDEEKKGNNPFAFLWPGNWGSSEKEEESDASQDVSFYEEEEEGDHPLAVLWPGNWFKDDDKVKPVTAEDVLSDMSPELHGMAETKGEASIRKARNNNLRKRQLNDDIELLLMRERPSRLSLFPVP